MQQHKVALVNHFGRFLCFDKAASRISHLPVADLDDDSIIWLSDGASTSQKHLCLNGRRLDLSSKKFTQTRAIAAQNVHVEHVLSEQKNGNDFVAIRHESSYLRSTPDGKTDFHADTPRDWEIYRTVRATQLESLQILFKHDWLAAATRSVLHRGTFQLKSNRALLMDGTDLGWSCTPLSEVRRAGIGSPDHPVLEAVIFRGDWQHDRLIAYRPLIVYCLFGRNSALLDQFRLSLESLHKFGGYSGDVLLLTDQDEDLVQSLSPEGFGGKILCHFVSAQDQLDMVAARLEIANLPFLEAYQPVLYSDLDVVFDAPIERVMTKLLMSDHISAQIEKFSELGVSRTTGGTLFQADPMPLNEQHGFCAGILGIPSMSRHAWMLRTAHKALSAYVTLHGRSSLPGYEQSMLNYSLRRIGSFNAEPITTATQIARHAEALNASLPRGFVHFWPPRLPAARAEQMKRYMDMLTETQKLDSSHSTGQSDTRGTPFAALAGAYAS